MKVQIKKNGDSKIITLPHTFVKFHGLEVDDWLDISRIEKVYQEKEAENESTI